jgi:hypothetical protein
MYIKNIMWKPINPRTLAAMIDKFVHQQQWMDHHGSQGRPLDDPTQTHGYMMDLSWVDCLLTRRSFAGELMCFTGGPITYKAKLLPTVACTCSSTKAEFMQASDTGHMALLLLLLLYTK